MQGMVHDMQYIVLNEQLKMIKERLTETVETAC